MLIRKNLTNLEIFNTAEALLDAFPNEEDIKLPIKPLFLFRKNMNNFITNAQDIEKMRREIIVKYGNEGENEGEYNFSDENLQIANRELEELFACEQEISYYTIPLESFGDTELSSKQMDAIMIMIEFEEE